MPVIVVIRQSQTQLPMQGQHVEHVLQVITVAGDGHFHRFTGIGAIVAAEPVGLVIRHVVTPLMFEYQIDETLEHAIEGVGTQRLPGHARQFVLLHPLIQQPDIDSTCFEPELQLGLILRQLRQHDSIRAIQR